MRPGAPEAQAHISLCGTQAHIQWGASLMPFSGLLPLWLALEEAGAGDPVTQRARPGLERGTSVYHPQGGPWSSSHLIQPVLLSFL